MSGKRTLSVTPGLPGAAHSEGPRHWWNVPASGLEIWHWLLYALLALLALLALTRPLRG